VHHEPGSGPMDGRDVDAAGSGQPSAGRYLDPGSAPVTWWATFDAAPK